MEVIFRLRDIANMREVALCRRKGTSIKLENIPPLHKRMTSPSRKYVWLGYNDKWWINLVTSRYLEISEELSFLLFLSLMALVKKIELAKMLLGDGNGESRTEMGET